MKTTLKALIAALALQIGVMLVGAPPASAAGVSPATGISTQLNTQNANIEQVRHHRDRHWRHRHHGYYGHHYRPHPRRFCRMERVRVWTEYGPRRVWVRKCYRGW